MSALMPNRAPVAKTTGGRLPRDAATMVGRELLRWRMQPWPVVIGLAFPVFMLLLFSGLFGGAMQVPGGGGYLQFLMPGVLTLGMLFGLEATSLAIATDRSRGVTDRFRTLPISSASVLIGRFGADMIQSVAGLLVTLAVGVALGWRWTGGFEAMLAAVGLLLALRVAMLWLGMYLGLLMPTLESLAVVQILVWPLGFLSSAYVDPATMPVWLGTIAAANPVSFTASAIRQLNGEAVAPNAGWLTLNALPLAVIAPVAITMLFLPLAARQYRQR